MSYREKIQERLPIILQKGHSYPSNELTSLDNGSITLDAWRQASRVSFRNVISDSFCIEIYNCVLSKSTEDVIELTSYDEMSTDITT